MAPAGTRRSLPMRRRGSTAAATPTKVTMPLHERFYAAYTEAARDPAFMADMATTTRAFDVTLADCCDGEQ